MSNNTRSLLSKSRSPIFLLKLNSQLRFYPDSQLVCLQINKTMKENISLPQWLAHSFGVAEKVYKTAKERDLTEEECQELWLMGLLHDCGKRFVGQDGHEEFTGNLLKRSGFKFSEEIQRHGETLTEIPPLTFELLRIADLSVDTTGHDIGFDGRLKDSKTRYGENSKTYKECRKSIGP